MAIVNPVGGIVSYLTRHRTLANLLMIILIGAGIFTAPQMRAQFLPDVIINNISVSVVWEGAGAEDVDATIVELMEPVLLGVEGVSSTISTAREGRASISVAFEPGWDMARAVDDVQVAVDTISILPKQAEAPVVRRAVWREPVTSVVITGPGGLEQLGRFADEFVARLFEAGVTRNTIRGIAAPEILVEVPTAALIREDVTMRRIASAIAAETEVDPAGDVSGANARVRTGVAKKTPEEIERIIIKTDDDGSSLTIGDIATVSQSGIDQRRAYFVGENPAVSIEVARAEQGDAIGILRGVEEVADKMRPDLPSGTRIELFRTPAEAISGRLDILIDNGVLGFTLVVCMLFLFLNARTALWVAAGIPVAMSAAIALMYFGGLTINMLSLFALIITLGIVVDDAIVVGEHADFRARWLKEDPITAAENAATRMAMPLFSAGLTTVIAFFGLVAISGPFGSLIDDIPFTIIAVLAASLVECFLILPHHMAHALRYSARLHWYDWPSRVVNIGFKWFRSVVFRRVMQTVVWARYPVVVGIVCVLIGQISQFISGEATWQFYNPPENGSISGNFAMSDSATRDDTLRQMRAMQAAVDELAAEYEDRYGRDPVKYVLGEVGGNTGRGLSGTDNKERHLLGAVAIELIDADLRPDYSPSQFLGDLQDRVRRLPLTETISFRGGTTGPGGNSLEVHFFGADAPTLKAAAEDFKFRLAQYPEVSAVEDSLAYDKDELVLELTPQGQALGFTIDALGEVLRDRLGGIDAATFPDGPRSATIRVELPPDELTADFLERTLLGTRAGGYVPLADIVRVERQRGFSTIRRENGLRLVAVTGDISGDDAARSAEIQREIREVLLPAIESELQVRWKLAGLSKQEQEFLVDAGTGFVLCLVAIYGVLAWVFSSWTRPLVVMAVIPFGLAGTIHGHVQWDVPLNLFTIVGLYGMTGIIINDSIVLVTTIDEYSSERGLRPAIVEAACDRLRPVLLTTLTTVLGLTPLLYETSNQAEFLKPTVITLCYGLTFGFFVVLLLVPALLAIQGDVQRQIDAFRRAVRLRRGLRDAGNSVALAGGAILVLFTLTIGWAIWSGGPHPIISGLLSETMAEQGQASALLIYLIGTIVILIFAYVLGAVMLGVRRSLKAKALSESG